MRSLHRIIIFLSLPFLLIFSTSTSQAQNNISQIGKLDYQEDLSDVWGYTDTSGHEYGLVTTEDGTSIVDISSDPANPTELFFLSGDNTTWRDVKVWDHHAYVTNEGDNGMLIIDLTHLPDSVTSKRFTWNNQFSTAHNIFIDEQGYAYIMGSDYQAGGALIFDLTQDPMNPVHAGTYDQRYVHDGFVRNDTFWSAEIEDGFFSVVDVSDKSNPNVMATQSTPSNFTHNLWLSDDGNTLFTTDERPDAYVASYDVSKLNNITELDRYQSSPGDNVVVHNTMVADSFVITSYYTDGVVVNDASQSNNLIETGHFDTSPLSGDGFNGCWGVYPYFSSGNLLATDIQEGLFVLDVNYQNAAYLEGTVTDSSSGNPIPNANITFLPDLNSDNTNLSGNYQTGLGNQGTFDVEFAKPGYISKTKSVSLVRDSTQTLDVELKEKANFSITGQVQNQATSNGVNNAIVNATNGTVSFNATTNSSGTFTLSNVFEDEYDIFTGKWGFKTKKVSNQTLQSSTGPVIKIEEGYYDDFFFDYNWQVTSTATAGTWERGEPKGTSYPNLNFFINPETDVSNDFGEQCFVTGNGGGSVGDDDVDDGFTKLSSPTMDLAGNYGDPYISFNYWFYNGGGQGAENDTLKVELSNNNKTVLIKAFEPDFSNSQWSSYSFRVQDYMQLSSDMQLHFTASDDQQVGHLVEAGIDRFQVIDSGSTSIQSRKQLQNTHLLLYPNPASHKLQIKINDAENHSPVLTKGSIYNAQGQQVKTIKRKGQAISGYTINVESLKPGIYFLEMVTDGHHINKKFTILR